MTAPLTAQPSEMAALLQELLANPEPGDATEPTPPDQPPTRGYLLEAPPEQAAKTLLDWWKDGERERQKRNALELRNTAWRKGVRNVQVVPDNDGSTWSVRYPLGGRAAPPQPNKVDDLIRGVVAAIVADPPAWDVAPETDDQADRDSATFSTRVLQYEASEARLNLPRLTSEALDGALTGASRFVYVEVDPAAGGQQPVVVEAYAHATTVQDATTPLPPELGPMGEPIPAPPPPPLIRRYVAEDGVTLTDDPAEAQHAFVPALVPELHRPATVQWLPATAPDLDSAEGVLLGRVLTLGAVKRRYPEALEGLTPEQVSAVVDWRPPRGKSWLPPARELLHQVNRTPKYADGTIADHALVFVLTCVVRACPSYPEGAVVHVLGGQYVARADFVLRRDDGGRDVLDLPIAHLLGLVDPEGDPMGRALADVLGPADEVRGAVLAAAQEYCWRFGRPIQYVPHGSTIKPIDLARRDGSPIPFNAEGGVPVFEQVPPFPTTLWETYDRLGAEMEAAAKLPPPAQGYASSNIKSGEHMQRVVEQSQQGMSDLYQHTGAFIARLGRLALQQMRAFYDVPRLLRFTTDDGAYEAQEWSKTDLGTSADVSVARGSFTMLPRTLKSQLATQEMQTAQAAGDPLAMLRYRRAIEGNVAPLLGQQDDPHRRRILRQVAQWKNGPPAEMVDESGALVPVPPPVPQQQPVMGPDGLPAVDVFGQPLVQTVLVPQPDPVAVASAQCFAPIPADSEPAVALRRWYELSHTMATTAYEAMDRRWQQGLVQAYEAARAAANVQTVPEQQQAQQAQAQGQQQQDAAQVDAQTAYAEQARVQAAQDRMQMGMTV